LKGALDELETVETPDAFDAALKTPDTLDAALERPDTLDSLDALKSCAWGA
jgi:hypothetical protein